MSANRKRPHYPIIPASYVDVGSMILNDVKVYASCGHRRCGHRWDLDLARIRDARGGYYSLVGRSVRRPKCENSPRQSTRWAANCVGFKQPGGAGGTHVLALQF
jgi:hypothetical protein